MTGPKIHEMSDEQLDGLTDEQLLAIGGEQEGGEEGIVEGELAPAATPQQEEGGEPLTAEQLEAIASGEQAIPKARLDEVLAALREQQEITRQLLAERNQPAQQAQPEPEPEPEAPAYDFKAKRREVIRLIADGDEEAAAALEDEIETQREAQRARDIVAAEERALQRMQAQRVQESMQDVVADVYERMPFLNNANKDADVAAIAAVNAKAKALVGEGVAPAEAVRQAAELIGPKFGEVKGGKASAGAVNPEAAAAKPVTPGADPRTQQAITRNLAVRQPSTTKTGVGNREAGSTISIKDISDEQLEAMEKSGELDKLLAGDRDD